MQGVDKVVALAICLLLYSLLKLTVQFYIHTQLKITQHTLVFIVYYHHFSLSTSCWSFTLDK